MTPADAPLPLIVIEALPAWMLGCYGGPIRTPGFDRLAANGIVYDNCFAEGVLDAAATDLPGPGDHIVRLEGISDRVVTAAAVAALPESTAADLRLLVGDHLPGGEVGPGDDPLLDDRLVELAEADPDARETLEDLEMLCLAEHVADCDAAVAAICEEYPPEDNPLRVVSLKGWNLSTRRHALGDPKRHCVAMISTPGRQPRRVATLTSPRRLLADSTPEDENVALLYVDGESAALRDASGLYMSIRGEVSDERLFEKPADRFDRLDLAREQPGRVEDYAARLRTALSDGTL